MSRPVRLPAALSAYRRANKHAARAITHRRAGHIQKAWQENAHARFWRTVALGHLNGL